MDDYRVFRWLRGECPSPEQASKATIRAAAAAIRQPSQTTRLVLDKATKLGACRIVAPAFSPHPEGELLFSHVFFAHHSSSLFHSFPNDLTVFAPSLRTHDAVFSSLRTVCNYPAEWSVSTCSPSIYPSSSAHRQPPKRNRVMEWSSIAANPRDSVLACRPQHLSICRCAARHSYYTLPVLSFSSTIPFAAFVLLSRSTCLTQEYHPFVSLLPSSEMSQPASLPVQVNSDIQYQTSTHSSINLSWCSGTAHRHNGIASKVEQVASTIPG
ncbi:hypothetical protein BKA80DRAFT_107252 [Phyllosticta citrichinensis]